MEKFSVKQLADLADVSVRTLHHYDKINLLKPSLRAESGYRYYGVPELYRLQQILLYKELDLSLAQIAEILDAPEFNLLDALRQHMAKLKERRKRTNQLLQTIEKTIGQLKTKNKTMNYEDLYSGFSKEKAEAYNKEAAERWGAETIASSHKRLMAMNKDEWAQLKKQGEDLYAALVKLLHLPPDENEVQNLIKAHYEMTGKHFAVTPEIYLSLGNMYVEDERFKAYYDQYDQRLAAFLREGIAVFVMEV